MNKPNKQEKSVTKRTVTEQKFDTWGHYRSTTTTTTVSNNNVVPRTRTSSNTSATSNAPVSYNRPLPSIPNGTSYDARPFQMPQTSVSYTGSSIATPRLQTSINRPIVRAGASGLNTNFVSSPARNSINLGYRSPYRNEEGNNRVLFTTYQKSQSLTNLLPKKLEIKKVNSSIQFLDKTKKHLTAYSTRSKNRGKTLIINNINFKDKTHTRHGAEVDQENLVNLFKKLKFWNAQFEKNYTAVEMEKRLIDFKNKSSNKYDIYMIIIMSHGTGEEMSDSSEIEGTDGKLLPITRILEIFKTFMPSKPKIFIFQCCRGEIVDKPATIQTDSQRAYSDMLLAFSTLPGYASHRDTQKGTWYIQYLCEVIIEHAHDTHFEDLLKIVDDKLNKTASRSNTQQTSTYSNRGFKTLYLHPGLSE